jgi:hypothetical protein
MISPSVWGHPSENVNVEEALAIVDSLLQPERLNTVQELVFCQCWLGQTYQDLAENFGYDPDYIRVTGSRLWQMLSAAFGEKVTKNNIHSVVRRYIRRQQGINENSAEMPNLAEPEPGEPESEKPESEEPEPIPGKPIVLELPEGQVPLNSMFYIERPPIESLCYETMQQPGSLIRIKASKRMGKTSLMIRILQKAREQGFRTIPLSLRLAEISIFKDLNRFLQWFCATISRSLETPNRLAGYWDEIFGASYNTTDYFENYLLPLVKTPIVLALDDVDVVFRHPEIASDFFSLLRAWHEKARYGDASSNIWQNLRLVVIHSTEVYIPLNINQSPFNVGLSIELPEFTLEQVRELASRYPLDVTTQLGEQGIVSLMALVRGNPYLVRLALYHISRGDVSLNQLLRTATSENSIFSDYLRQQLLYLEQHPQLESVYSLIVNSPLSTVELEPARVYELQSLGMVRVENNQALPSCELYRQYFKNRLGVW